MASAQVNVNGSRTLVDGHDGMSGSYGTSLSRNEEEEEEAEEENEDNHNEQEAGVTDEEEAAHAVSLATQWVIANTGAHVLSQVVIRDYSTDSIYDEFVRPPPTVQIVDYRREATALAGGEIHGSRAVDFDTVQTDVWGILQDRLLVGHRLWDSLHLLNIQHPLSDTRDLALYLPFQPDLNVNTPPLLNIQPPVIVPLVELTRSHLQPMHWLRADTPRVDASDYAEAQMLLYQSVRPTWESLIALGHPVSAPPPNQFRIGDHNYYL